MLDWLQCRTMKVKEEMELAIVPQKQIIAAEKKCVSNRVWGIAA